MRPSETFKTFIKDQLAAFGPVGIRNMFGGAGVYADDVMFALIADDTLYLKADDTTARAFEAEGMRPFTYTAKGAGGTRRMGAGGSSDCLRRQSEISEAEGKGHAQAKTADGLTASNVMAAGDVPGSG